MSELAYWNGSIMPLDAVSIPATDRGFLFGDAVYELVRIYHQKPFLFSEHIARLSNSLNGINIIFDLKDIAHQARELIKRAPIHDGILYIQITRGAGKRRHVPSPDLKPNCLMYVQELPREPILEKRQRGIKTKFLPDLRHQFCRLKTTNLLANLLALTEAYQDGAEEALLVNGELQISEGSHTNFAMIHQGTLITPPLEQNILPGITRLHTLALARQLNIPIVEKPVTRDMILNEAAELMILGTTTEIMPVIQVDHHKINQGQPGPMTKKLIQAFDASIV